METINEKSKNPLLNYTRKPEIYITLPSNGHFTVEENMNVSVNGELGVSAMTTSDELILKTPDALLNGEAIVKIIKSCVPDVVDVYNLIAPDVDAILVAIRYASYGDGMDFVANCPVCETEKHFSISLTEVLSKIQTLESEYVVELSNKMKVSIMPYTFKSMIKEGLMAYNEAQILKVVLNEDLTDPETTKQYQESFNKMAELVVELAAECVVGLWDPDGNYIDATTDQIHEWLQNIPRADADKIQSKINEINAIGVYKKAALECENESCKHKWEADISFDASNFFG